MFIATVRSLIAGDYLAATTDLSLNQVREPSATNSDNNAQERLSKAMGRGGLEPPSDGL